MRFDALSCGLARNSLRSHLPTDWTFGISWLTDLAGLVRNAEAASSSLAPSTNFLQQFAHFFVLACGNSSDWWPL